MAKKNKGRSISGWLVIDKPVGITSNDAVNRVRRALGARKAGHTGTLDSLASGVLVVAFGEATKCIHYIADRDKNYQFTVQWGAETETDDSEGQVIAESDVRPAREDIVAALPQFVGNAVMQLPPKYSAIHINGQRAYKLAREGKDFAIQPRPVRIDSLELATIDSSEKASFTMRCGKGTYVRSIARDLGQYLGCYGHVSSLRRTECSSFSIDNAIPLAMLEEMRDMDECEKLLLPLTAGLDDIPAFAISGDMARRLQNGQPVAVVGAHLSYGSITWAQFEKQPVAIGVVRGGCFYPDRVFNLSMRL